MLGRRHRCLRWLRWRRRRTSLLLLLDRRARAKLPGPALAISLGVHEQMAIAIEVVPHTGCPSFCLALEAEVWILQFQCTIDLLQRHRVSSFR